MNIFYLFYLASTPFSGYNKKQKLTDSEVSGMGRNATLKDVAEKVGLSVASVSLVLNQKPNRISLESQERIFAAAEQLGYKPKFRQPRAPSSKTNHAGPDSAGNLQQLFCRHCAGRR